MNRNTAFNVGLFVLLAAAVGGTWWYVESTFFQKPAPTPEPPKPARETVLALAGGAVMSTEPASAWPSKFVPATPKPEKPVEAPKPVEPPKATTPAEPYRLIALGGEGFNKRVLLTTRGGGIQQVILPAFDHASRLGVESKDESGQPYPLELLPGYYRERDNTSVKKEGEHRTLTPTEPGKTVSPTVAAYLSEPSYVLFHYPMPGDPQRLPDDKEKTNERFPSPELGARLWKVVAEVPGTDETDAKVVFETALAAPYHLLIRKTFVLGKRDYHVRMKLEFVGQADRQAEGKSRTPFKYQIAGGHGLPVEGEWYTSTYRSAQVGWRAPNGTHKRDIQDSSSVTTQHGGNTVEAQGSAFTYAAVSTQYFATALAVDPDAPDEWKKDPWAYVRATRERSPGVPEDKPQLGDITVRAVSRPVDPPPGQTVTHSYWIYNGPIKVRLLKHLELLEAGKRGYTTDDATVDRYLTDLGLNTMTDAPTPNWFGAFANAIYWTDLVVFFTNLMHGVLGWLHKFVPIWGVNILILTVLVRLLLMVPSRRQQASMLKMQEKMAAMKPELDKLTEKYRNDPQRLNQEKTRLMIQHGVNPLSSMGGCLLMFAQMPVFMGLYFCLQESIFFRLDRFLWIENLAAPDMLFTWSESIPFLSTAADMGGMVYLGPYLNVLPVLAIALMYVNMVVSTPPPTDEQQEMNQKMMKYMMIFMGFFFYKMAAGMCVYFIVSTLWGLTERKLLKKKLPDAKLTPEPAPALVADPGPAPKAGADTSGGGLMGRFRQRLLEKMEEMQQTDTGRQIVNNPPKPGQPPQPGANGKGPGGKKKRKKK